MTDRIKGLGALITTAFIFVILLWWLIVVALHVGTNPVVNADGVVTLDTFQRTKDILLVVLPLATTAVGFWLGSQGTAQAQETAQTATRTAETAQAEAVAAKDQLMALVDVSEAHKLQEARNAHPAAFGLRDPNDPDVVAERYEKQTLAEIRMQDLRAENYRKRNPSGATSVGEDSPPGSADQST